MAHDVFISHSTKNKQVADAICATLENAAIRCWIAPRDVQPGRSFAGEITRAINGSKAIVLIFSADSNNSEQILRELQLAANARLHIIQFRIEDVAPNEDLQYYLSTPHWFDATTAPLEKHLGRLAIALKTLLGTPEKDMGTSAREILPPLAESMAEGSDKTIEHRPSPTIGAPPSQADLSPGSIADSRGLDRPREPAADKPAIATPSRPENKNLGERGAQWLKVGKRKAVLLGAMATLLVAAMAAAWWLAATRGGSKVETVTPAATVQPTVAAQERAAQAVTGASKERPYENSLGMKFVPVAGTGVLFSIWETRVKDFAAFVEASSYDATGGMVSLDDKGKGWVQAGRTWKDPGFEQTGKNAVCGVSWDDAVAFCDWLTKEERKTRRLSQSQSYRLPSDLEWSAALGLGEESGTTPKARDQKVKGVYPWGTKWPPPAGAGNYAGSEARTRSWPSSWPTIEGYQDGYARTSPVGSFAANEKGIYDLGGNVWEWCEDWWSSDQKDRVLRGASCVDVGPDDLLSSYRLHYAPEYCYDGSGFRCVLVVGSSR